MAVPGRASATLVSKGISAAAEPTPDTRLRLREAFGKLPLYFVENKGQLDAQVAYYLQGRDASMYFGRRLVHGRSR